MKNFAPPRRLTADISFRRFEECGKKGHEKTLSENPT
jgi:hypothetical protein